MEKWGNGLKASRAKCTPLPVGNNIGGLFGCKIGKRASKGAWKGNGAPSKVCCIKTTNKAGVQEEHCAQMPRSVYLVARSLSDSLGSAE